MPTLVAGLSGRLRWIVLATILLLVGTAIVAVLNSSMLLAIARVTAKSPEPPRPSTSTAATTTKKTPRISDIPCTEENIAELINQLERKRRKGFIVDVRPAAARRLEDCGAVAALPALEKMSKDKDPVVKAVALEAIAKIKKAN